MVSYFIIKRGNTANLSYCTPAIEEAGGIYLINFIQSTHRMQATPVAGLRQLGPQCAPS